MRDHVEVFGVLEQVSELITSKLLIIHDYHR